MASNLTQTIRGTITTSPPVNASTNITQLNGTTVDTNSGNKSNGTLRVVIATDQPNLTSPLNVAGTVTANAGTNLNTSLLALEAGGNLASLVTQVGAVTASPTANTLMDRVKSLLTGIVLAAGSAIIGKVGIDQTTPGTTNLVASGQNGTWTVQPGNTPNTSAWLVSQTPATSGGLSISRTLSANNTTALTAKGSAGQLYGFVITNTNASARFVKFYNATSASVGTTTPVITLVIPGNANGAGMVAAEWVSGIAFSTGIQYGITTGVADNDTGSPAANEVVVNAFYK